MPDVVDTGPWPGLVRAESQVILDYQGITPQIVGSWTPEIYGLTTQGTATYTMRKGDFVKTGNLLFLAFHIDISNHTGSGRAFIRGYGNSPIVGNISSYAGLQIIMGNGQYETGGTGNFNYFNPYIFSHASLSYLQSLPSGGSITRPGDIYMQSIASPITQINISTQMHIYGSLVIVTNT